MKNNLIFSYDEAKAEFVVKTESGEVIKTIPDWIAFELYRYMQSRERGENGLS